MSNQIKNYYYNQQVKRYIVQFMEIFRNLTAVTGVREDGETKELDVPITYGSRDRVSAAILNKNTQNTPIKVPTMSAYVRSINVAPDLRKGVGGQRRQTFLPKGGLVPDDIKTIKHLMPVPYRMSIDLSIWTSNTDQQFQILEQILMYFDPDIQLQTSDEAFDWAKIATVELKNINFDEQYPIGVSNRLIVSTLTFELPIYIAGPSNLKSSFVAEVFARISAVSDMDEFVNSIYSAMDEEYTSMSSAKDLDIDQ